MAVGDINLRNKIVVVTGGASGIHLAFSRLARAEGAKVIIADLQIEDNAIQLDENILFHRCDVSKWSDLDSLTKISLDTYGDVPDIYVAGAGVFEPNWSNFWDDKEDENYQAVQVNVSHPIKLTRLAIRAFQKHNKKGVVLIMASIAGYSSQFPAPLYSATKHALVGFTRSMQPLEELAGVKVVAICPGLVKTPLWTSNAEASDRFQMDDSLFLTAESVAQAELKLVKEGQYGGGTVYEISLFGERVVPEWNISPPGHDSPELLKGAEVPKEAMERALRPILQSLESDRTSA
ncbi:NAD(P)-binding protein [Pyrenochaeta sp. DS3sAY3a]|nr:NAD(P)-binding protein [Pyrenochaeta sp. DS3sAY3a]